MPRDRERLAPITITFMLACHTSGDPVEFLGRAHWESPAGKETRAWLKVHDLIDENNRSTEKGARWVEFICEAPLPVLVWSHPDDL